MVSAVFTEPGVSTEKRHQDGSCYAISPPVRVRKETFGLLFYHTEESRLTFVKSGKNLQIKTFPHGKKMIVACIKSETQVKMRKLLDHLIKKRLICES